MATYLILLGFIIYLLILLSIHKVERYGQMRDMILSAEELQKHAMEIARNHPVGKASKSLHWLVRRLNENYAFIINVYKALNIDVKRSFPTAPAAEWLLDNFYIIEEQVKLIRRNLSKGGYSRLPILTEGYLKGHPRVYAIALEMVAHTNGSIDEKTITTFIQAYQSQTLLSMGELWALPLMLRISLVESIRNECEKVRNSRIEWHRAEEFMSRIISLGGDEQQIDAILGRYFDERNELTPSFAEHLIQGLRKQGKGHSAVTALLDKRLENGYYSIKKLTEAEHLMQAEMQVAISNSITGLRLISDLDWSEIFELLSNTEQILRQDPNGIYGLMDFESRDFYRHEVERLARAYRIPEIHVARVAVECASECEATAPQDHVGYYLVGKGRKTLIGVLEKATGRYLGFSLAPFKRPKRLYTIMVFLLTVFLVSYFTYYALSHDNAARPALSILAALLVIIPCSEFALTLTNTIVNHIFTPTMLPKLELKTGIPEELATFVIVPTLLTSTAGAVDLISQLEVYYLANREKNLFFALVGDFKDAPSQEQKKDEAIIKTALEEIAELNRKYSGNGPGIFYYMHRKRVFNAAENRWMGWERKRGAIAEFNRLLRGDPDTGFTICSGDVSLLPAIGYVITLDADTNLPMGAARRLIGTIAHPLNRASIDKERGLVREGYGLIQPRICVSITASNCSYFTKIFAGQGGLDPYTTAVSDIYQDIFDEGIFTGKGIYEIDAFTNVLEKKIPDNTVLSHDLIEGCYLRAGLASDIELVDGYPASYSSYSARQHRWTRGDWQLLPWLGREVRNREGEKVRNSLSGLCKWKILDNLRRSLLSPSLLVLLFAGITLLPGSDLVWLGFALLVTFSPLTTGILNALLTGNIRFLRNRTNSTIITGIKAAIYQSLLLFMLMPHQSKIMLDAVVRTIYRVCYSHKNMLEWITAADVEANAKNTVGSYFRKMWVVLPASSIVIIGAIWAKSSILLAFIAAVLWLLSPWVAHSISRPVPKKRYRLTHSDINVLRRVSRKTWRYFEDFAGEEDNYLPPDNYQENPPKGAAHRTSPTNIGLMLLSALSAGDMGYVGFKGLADILGSTISTVERMEKWRGHLFNWYDTKTLEVLRPMYVSTVDSGNLVGYMIVVREGLKEYLKKKVPMPSLAMGIKDTLELVCEEEGKEIDQSLRQTLVELSKKEQMDPLSWASVLEGIAAWLKNEILDQAISDSQKNESSHMKKSKRFANGLQLANDYRWSSKLNDMVQSFMDELLLFYPFLNQPDALSILDEEKNEFSKQLRQQGTPMELLQGYRKAASLLGKKQNTGKASELLSLLKQTQGNIEFEIDRYNSLIERISKLIDETKFSPLFDHKRLLFSIGYNTEDEHLSKSCYDLLASEARQASYIAIATGEVDRRHWLRMSRKLTAAEGGKGLVSWTGTMFEYLMPLLIMRNYENTLFDETYSFVVKVQKKYGKQRRMPWGISESGYSALDFNLNYQYKAFGVPELGLKRGLANDMVAAPYASILALGVDAMSAVENLKELSALGLEGKWGYYEAIDFTPSRLMKGNQHHIVKSFMAHHQGMCMAALNNFFNENVLRERFHANPFIRSAELLLQEKIPEKVLYTKEFKDDRPIHSKKADQPDGMTVRTFGLPSVIPPSVHILSNGLYSVMITDGGSGYSMNGDMAVTRWSADSFEKSGFYIFIQNINSNTGWPATYDPTRVEPDKYKVTFSPYKAEFVRKDSNLESHLEVAVSPEDNAEIRKVSITNHSENVRIVEITSYFEPVLAARHEDASHPAFSKLFVEVEYNEEQMCLIASRRCRSQEQILQWLVHTMALESGLQDNGLILGDLQYEIGRLKFIGRNRDISNPEALEPDQPLSNGAGGSAPDPIASLRRRIKIEPGQTIRVVYSIGVAPTRELALKLAEKYNDYRISERVFELAWTRSQVENRYFGLESEDIEFYLELMPLILYKSHFKREYAAFICDNIHAQQDLWTFGISGDLPIILVEVNDLEDIDMVQWAIKGHEYWQLKGLRTDLVILLNKKEGYSQPLNDRLRNAVSASHARELLNKYGGVFILNSTDMDSGQIALFYTAARIVVKDSLDALKNIVRQLRTPMKSTVEVARYSRQQEEHSIEVHQRASEEKLLFFNGIGGFSADGREYVIRSHNGRHTPTPWSNIIANKSFGFLVTQSGGGYTWSENSREFKLTPWANDPVTDRQGEVLYVTDTHKQCSWSMTPMPAGDNEPYTIRHGRGYSVFEHSCLGLKQSLTTFVAMEQPVKICLISIVNNTGRRRRLAITYYVRPVLGVNEEKTSPYIVTWRDEKGVVFAENKFTQEFRGRIAFLATNLKDSSFCGDTIAFIGHKGDLSMPYGLMGDRLPNVEGAGLDPCMAIRGEVDIGPEEEAKIIFLLGSAKSVEDAAQLAGQFTNVQRAVNELDNAKGFWRNKLESIQIHTPDDSFDVMMNGWFMYQTVACRMWARSGYYQAGGAYGFRDQLQDSMSLLNTWPEMTRKQILLHASRQFIEGDVQHWWHAESGKGIRTRYSDDLLWLAFVTGEYIVKTDDSSILNEQVPFIKGSVLEEGEDEKYEETLQTDISASLYEHCTLAIDRSLKTGPHGLPLMGSGDWNDGMNTVGNKGRGESVWLGWFLICILKKFIPICNIMQDEERAEKYRDALEKLVGNIEKEAWDGSWYRRAYFDDGKPLGSSLNSECMIDSISQSWSVISGMAEPQRMQEAMAAVQKYLVDSNEGIIKLLAPPFDKGGLHPGYIKGYVPGVRENGGQYTHAATWVVLAFAKLGMGDKAIELFHMLNPINHTRTDIEYSRYKTEPYVIAADVYAVHPHMGRGGWTWYTGAAGWLYKVGLEHLMGFVKKGDRLYIDPCVPKSWDKFQIEYNAGKAVYRVEVKNPDGVNCGVTNIYMDGKPCQDGYISLGDQGFHRVEVVMGGLLN